MPFRDRVVHHALHAILGEIFERGFNFDSYASCKGKVTHRAAARYEQLRNRFRYVLRCDIYRYFLACCNCYRIRPVLLQTFVEQRFQGTRYRAANWLHVGQTDGCGRFSVSTKPTPPIKDIWAIPTVPGFQANTQFLIRS